jgi:hypothetical protein
MKNSAMNRHAYLCRLPVSMGKIQICSSFENGNPTLISCKSNVGHSLLQRDKEIRNMIFLLLKCRNFLLFLGGIYLVANIFLVLQLPILSQEPHWSRSLSHTAGLVERAENNVVNHDGGGILHIVMTRFMQQQSKLHVLGKARLKLFETFCLPSMNSQMVSV